MSDEALTTVTAEGELVVGGFRFSPTELIPIGEPDFEAWDNVGVFLRYIHTGSQFWIGDWLNYGEHAYGEKYSQAVEHTGYDLHTLQTYSWIARQVSPENRIEKVPFGHYANGIAALEPAEQKKWVKKVIDEEMTQAELRQALRLARRAKVAKNVPLPPGKFRVILADPPWSYDDEGEIIAEGSGSQSHTKAVDHYPTMSIEELVKFFTTVKDLATDDAVMFMWATAPLLLQNPGPREVIEAAGFVYKTGRVWDKGGHVYGSYFSNQHEHLLVCTRGSCTPDQLTPMLPSVIREKKSKKNSEKPASVYKDIERLYTTGPYLELFGRDIRKGWTVYGNDLKVADVA